MGPYWILDIIAWTRMVIYQLDRYIERERELVIPINYCYEFSRKASRNK